MESIYSDVYCLVRDETTKISKKAFDILDKECIANIMKQDGVFWFEEYMMGNDCPKHVKEYLISFIKRNLGLKYLYDLKG